ncbi:MAG: penicillin acylase family protein [Hymenobacter sp.]
MTIVRDTWGVPHITGKTDADAVFWLLYAQCEDDFARVEDNYLTALGRWAEVRGEAALYEDLRQRLFLDSAQAVAHLPAQPALDEGSAARLCRRHQLLPGHPPHGAAPAAAPLPALDAAACSARAASAAT